MVRKLEPGEKVPFTEHLTELRHRLLICAGVVCVFFLGSWGFSDSLLAPFAGLLGDRELVFINPTEAFFAHVKVAFYASLAFSMPVLLYQFWAYVAPGLMEAERKGAFLFLIFSTIFFLVGASFCFLLILPFGLKFLIGFGGELLSPMLSVSSVIGFSVTLMFVFGLVFQLPIIVVFLNVIGVVGPEHLTAFRPYLVVSAFIVSAIITPPDVFTQVVLSLPMILLYEVGILVVKITGRKKQYALDMAREEETDGE